jgi:glutamine synthetase
LGWTGVGDRMIRDANPGDGDLEAAAGEGMQTVELRSPDGSANVHLLLAGMAVAARCGLEHPEALAVADRYYVAADAHKLPNLAQLPASCHEAAECLRQARTQYEEGHVFPPGLIDAIIRDLQAYGDQNLSEKLFGDEAALSQLVNKYQHCG